MPEHGLRAGLALLARRDVRRLALAYAITFTGTAMAPIALAFGVLELTGSARDSAVVIAAPTLAATGVLLFGGAIADRHSRQRLIVGAELLAMLAQAGAALLFLSGQATVPRLTILMALNGIAMGLNVPAATGMIVQLVEREQLQNANALLSTARNGALAGGAALGGVLVAVFGAGTTLLIDALSFGVSALLVATLTPRRQTPPESTSLFEDLRLGWREFTAHTWLWVIVLQFSVLVAVHEAIFGLLGPAVARSALGGAAAWGAIAGAFGVGTLVGGFVSLQVRVRRPMRLGTLLTFSFCTLPLALAVPIAVPLLALVAFGQGVCGQIFAVLWYTTLQRRIPGHLLSRVSAYDHLGSIVLAPLGIVVAGWLYESLGSRTTLAIGTLTAFLPTVAAFCVRDVREMTSET